MPKPTFDAASTDDELSVSDTSISWSHTCTGSDRILLVGVMWTTSVNSPSATYNSVAMTLFNSVADGSGRVVGLWTLVAPSTGANTVSVSWTTAARPCGIGLSYTGVHQTNPYGDETLDANSTGTASITFDTLNNDLGVDFVGVYRANNTTPPGATAGGSQTSRGTVANAAGAHSARLSASDINGGGSVTMTWSLTNQTTWMQIGIPLHGLSSGFFMAAR